MLAERAEALEDDERVKITLKNRRGVEEFDEKMRRKYYEQAQALRDRVAEAAEQPEKLKKSKKPEKPNR